MKPTKTMKTKTETGLLGKLAAPGDKREPGWKTLDELLEADPMARTTARRLLYEAVRDGIVIAQKMKSPTKNGLATRINYREK